ncbi:MAG: ankyrin repeat domain-containing protein [Cystobacter sp.]
MASLMDAVRLGDASVVEALLQRDPASLHRGDSQGMTPLMWAAWHGTVELVRVLLARGAQRQVRGVQGTTALMISAARGHLEATRELMPDTPPEERDEALRQAVGAGQHTVALWLLDAAGAHLEAGGEHGKTPLTCAVLGGHSALTDELLRRGANVAATSVHVLPLDNQRDSGWQPLHYAADRRHALLVQQLLDAGAAVDARTTLGTTPLMLAVLQADEDTVRVLLSAGAEPQRENEARASALSLSRLRGRPHITRLLERRAEQAPLTRVLHGKAGLGERAS